jgi:hypothetical protein
LNLKNHSVLNGMPFGGGDALRLLGALGSRLNTVQLSAPDNSPDLVRQEFYAWVLAHYAVRWLLHPGAAKHRLQHGQLSFKAHVQLLKREQPRSGSFPPGSQQKPRPR